MLIPHSTAEYAVKRAVWFKIIEDYNNKRLEAGMHNQPTINVDALFAEALKGTGLSYDCKM